MLSAALAETIAASFAIIDVLSCPSGGWISGRIGGKKSLLVLLSGAAIVFLPCRKSMRIGQ